MLDDDYKTRLAMAEMKLEQHDKLHEELQESIKVLSDGITKLVQAEIRREQDTETLGRVFSEVAKTNATVETLKKEFEDYKAKQLEKELAAYKGIVWKVLGVALLVVASLFAGHFGGVWLG